jgi:REP element-mobilizing transposase RayT
LPRPPRLYGNSKIYHIILKGIDDQDIFYDDRDREFFLKQISITKTEFNYMLYSYCLMSNHVHMVIRCQDIFLSKCIQSLLIRYVHYFNKKYKRKGPLVQNRFQSKHVENLKYFIDVCRYVHRNPENAGIELTQNYQWSSYKEYIGRKKIVDKNVLLHYYNDDINNFVEDTIKTINENNIEDYIEYEIIGKMTDEQLTEVIMNRFKINDISELPRFFKYKDEDELKQCMQEIKKIQGINKNQVARVTRLGRSKVEKIWNKIEPALNA